MREAVKDEPRQEADEERRGRRESEREEGRSQRGHRDEVEDVSEISGETMVGALGLDGAHQNGHRDRKGVRGDEERPEHDLHSDESYANNTFVERFFVVEANYKGWRLDQFLAQKIGRLSRSRVKRLIDRGEVSSNGAVANASVRLRGGETIRLARLARLPVTAEPRILFCDDAVVVVDKPHGLVVHPSARYPAGTLVDWFARRGERTLVVHRLDRETSGVMVLARTREAARLLVAAFERVEPAGRVEKTYVARVHGDFAEPITIDLALGFDPHSAIRIKMAALPGGQSAVTHVAPLTRFGAETLVEAHPLTGRQHQIRVHLAATGHPVVGDTLYGATPPRLRDPWEPGRLYLHSRCVQLTHPVTGQRIAFEAPMPADFLR